MSEELVDLKRLRLTRRGRAWLTARTIKTGRSAQDIVRDMVDERAADDIHGAKLLLALSSDEAHVGDSKGRGAK